MRKTENVRNMLRRDRPQGRAHQSTIPAIFGPHSSACTAAYFFYFGHLEPANACVHACRFSAAMLARTHLLRRDLDLRQLRQPLHVYRVTAGCAGSTDAALGQVKSTRRSPDPAGRCRQHETAALPEPACRLCTHQGMFCGSSKLHTTAKLVSGAQRRGPLITFTTLPRRLTVSLRPCFEFQACTLQPCRLQSDCETNDSIPSRTGLECHECVRARCTSTMGPVTV